MVNKEIINYGPWTTKSFCIECREQLTERQIYWNKHGVCPYCGHISELRILPATSEKVVRRAYTYIPKWWEFWRKAIYHWETKE
jgi:DNA-directed RNA polymerase subunit RPC12/RpoP